VGVCGRNRWILRVFLRGVGSLGWLVNCIFFFFFFFWAPLELLYIKNSETLFQSDFSQSNTRILYTKNTTFICQNRPKYLKIQSKYPILL
jgi:hypothetical protein